MIFASKLGRSRLATLRQISSFAASDYQCCAFVQFKPVITPPADFSACFIGHQPGDPEICVS